MLQLHFANRLEALTDRLLQQLHGTSRDAFVADQVIVPSTALRRSLTLAIADREGICANVQFGFLAQWLWQQIGRLVPAVAAQSPFAAPVLAWRVYRAFDAPAFTAAHPRLAAYLAGADDVMRFELAHRVAGLLEQYVTYRPDWLRAWQLDPQVGSGTATRTGDDPNARADERWQAALWHRITVELGVDALHPATTFVEALQRGGLDAAAASGLPASAHLFALPTMPPLYIELLQRLGQWVDLHLYVLNPCREYWFEIIDRARLSHLAARDRAHGHEEGNRLLAGWGRQTQSHIDLLVEHLGADTDDDARFTPHPGGTLLARVQNAILDLTELAPGTVRLDAADRSIEVHVCHGLARELEVLHDHLLGLFGNDPALQPADILVVTPDLEAAAPLIEAVFGTAPAARFIPYAITGRARSGLNAPAQALLALLALVRSRCAATAVFGLLQQGIVARRFGLDDAGLQQVHDWIRASGIRWALDADHRASFDLPAAARHTLADGLDRLFLGYATPAHTQAPFAGQLPAGNAEGSDALALGALWRFVTALRRLHETAAVSRLPEAWVGLLLAALDTFVQPIDDEREDLRELQQTIRGLADAMEQGGLAGAVPLAVFRAALEQALDDPARGGGPTGRVTFASMSSLRNLPFQVVCTIGMNDGDFPTAHRPPEFDLMALHPRRGDRQRRSDERNLFLDLLLAARRSLYISYTGRSVRDNAPLPPSVLVAELLEVVVPAAAVDPGSPAAASDVRRRLVVEHPLQPFSALAFDPRSDARVRSYNGEFAQALRDSLRVPEAAPAPEPAAASAPAPASARALPPSAASAAAATARSSAAPADVPDDPGDDEAVTDDLEPVFFQAPLPVPGPEWHAVSLDQLIEFFRNPCRFLLRHRLGIAVPRNAEILQDDEPFLADWPTRQALARRLLPALLEGADAATVRRLALAGTELPAGALGTHLLAQELQTLTRFAARIRAATQAPSLLPHQAALALTIDGQAWQLHAGFADLRAAGLVRWRYDQLRAGDRLQAWLTHLVLCAAPAAGAASQTTWMAIEDATQFGAVADPVALLRDLLRIYRQGLREPAHFFPKAAWAYCDKDSLVAATRVWQVTAQHPYGEFTDPAYRLALRGLADPLDDAFENLARRVFEPLLTNLRENAPAA